MATQSFVGSETPGHDPWYASAVDLDEIRNELDKAPTLRPEGHVCAVTGLRIAMKLPGARVGDVVRVDRRGRDTLDAEVIGFDEGQVLTVPLGDPVGIGVDDRVRSTGAPLEVLVGPELLGRVLDGVGRPIDGQPLPAGLRAVTVDRQSPPPLARGRIERVFPTGVRAIDGLLTMGVGQRLGLFAGSGVGKSSLLSAIARGAEVDVVVVALVGERGREVREFLEDGLGASARSRAVAVVSTSDAPAIERVRAPQTATAIAEAFRDQGARVLLLVDSITRFARAQREVGLAAGEPPTRRGYPPSVFYALPRLLERSGPAEHGDITAIYAVLVEGGDLDEPIADEVRGILDGQVVLERSIAARGRYPAIDLSCSLSRVMPALVSSEHRRWAENVRQLVTAYEEKRDLIVLGVYTEGSDPLIDRALRVMPQIDAFLRQTLDECGDLAETCRELKRLSSLVS